MLGLKFDALDSVWKPHRDPGCWAGESCCGKAGGEDFYSSASCGNQGDMDQLSQPVTSLPTSAMGTVHMAALSLKTNLLKDVGE